GEDGGTPGRCDAIDELGADHCRHGAADDGAILFHAETVVAVAAHALVAAGAEQQVAGYGLAAAAEHLSDLAAQDCLPAPMPGRRQPGCARHHARDVVLVDDAAGTDAEVDRGDVAARWRDQV